MNTRRGFLAAISGLVAFFFGRPKSDLKAAIDSAERSHGTKTGLKGFIYAKCQKRYTATEVVNAIQIQLNDYYARHGNVQVQLFAFEGADGCHSAVGVGGIANDDGMPIFSHEKMMDAEVERFIEHICNRPNRAGMTCEPTFSEWRHGKL